MNIFKKMLIFSKITLYNIKFLFLTAVYFGVCSLRWQAWDGNMSQYLNDIFSWISWCITILPVFFFLYHLYINWIGLPAIYVRIRDHKMYLKYFGFFTFICSLIVSLLYGVCSYLPYIVFYVHNMQFLLFLKNEIFLFVFLNLYGLLFCIFRYIRFKEQLIQLLLIILPALDHVLFFYFGVSMSQNAALANTDLSTAFYYLIPWIVLYLLFHQILYLLIERNHAMEIQYDKI